MPTLSDEARSRFVLVASGAVLSLAVGVLVARVRDDRPAVEARPAPSPTPAVVVVGRPLTGDVDGDGRRDTVRLVEQGDPAEPTWRWGVRARLTGSGVHFAWRDFGTGATERRELVGVVDVNGDRHAEVVVSPSATATGRGYALLTLTAGRLLWVTATVALTTGPNRGWGCDGRGVFTMSIRRDGTTMLGEQVYYELDGNRLVRGVYTAQFGWRPGTPAPAPFGRSISCGALRR